MSGTRMQLSRTRPTQLRSIALLLVAVAGWAHADAFTADPNRQSPSPVIRVGPQHAITTVAEAARVARNGDVVEIEAGVFPNDVASWSQDPTVV